MEHMNGMDHAAHSGLPTWLTTASWVYLAVCIVSALAIGLDVAMRRRRSEARGFDFIWAVAALYLGPLALPAYAAFGRRREGGAATTAPMRRDSTAARALMGGVASGLAHLVVVPFVVVTGITLFGMDMWAMIAIITVVATAVLFAYERSLTPRGASRPPRTPSPMVAALATIVSFDVGMLAWMLLLHFTGSMPGATDIRFTFLMQLGVVLGTLTAYPVVRGLTARRSPERHAPDDATQLRSVDASVEAATAP